jgi:ureidoacrylate peracid hydrolase
VTSTRAASTALLLIDLQNAFCSPGGSLAPDAATLQRYDRVIEQAVLMVATARAHGVQVIYLRHVYRPGYPEAHATMPFLARLEERRALLRDSEDAALVGTLVVGDRDLVVDKSHFDGFHATELDALLRARGVSELVVAGVSTNVCVESTVRSGSERGYATYVASDATAATSDQLHVAALQSMAYAFASIGPWREARCWQQR